MKQVAVSFTNCQFLINHFLKLAQIKNNYDNLSMVNFFCDIEAGGFVCFFL